MNFSSTLSPSVILVPLYDFKIPAGFESPATDYLEERIDLVQHLVPHPLSTFYCKSTGDSMNPYIPPESILIVDRSLKVSTGDIVIAYINGAFTTKFIKYSNGRCFLIPANPKYPIRQITEEMHATIWGKVTNIVIDTKQLKQCMPS